jgi:hypothetical protein
MIPCITRWRVTDTGQAPATGWNTCYETAQACSYIPMQELIKKDDDAGKNLKHT